MSDNAKPFRIGVAGLGTVGCGVVKVLQDNADLIQARTGRDIKIISVTAANKDKDRGVDLSAYEWADSLSDMAKDERLDVVVEMIGGSEGQAKDFIVEALKNGKHIVTANKALLAHHGFELSQLAEKNNVSIAYEAAVAGGIPIIKTLREGLAANQVSTVYGILNGTCNYILTEMQEKGLDFKEVLKDAQKQGFAEADPSFDIDGIDAAHKLVLLGAIAFGVKPDFQSLGIEGISHVTMRDIKHAEDLGYKIKLIGMVQQEGDSIVQTIAPCLVPKNGAMGSVEGVYNAVMTQGDFAGTTFIVGRGAGEGPTASSVVADIIDLAKGNIESTFGVKINELDDVEWQGEETLNCQCYIHFHVKDVPGVIADITACLKDKNISIDSFIQKGHEKDGTASVAIITHLTSLQKIKNTINSARELSSVLDEPTLMRIEDI